MVGICGMTPHDLSVLVLGAGGREHALVQACLRSPLVKRVIAAPGNAGMESEVDCFAINESSGSAVLELVQRERVDFVIVGPEAPLAAGVADSLRGAGVPTYGPGRKGAQLESSKVFCKNFFARHGIPTAAYATFTETASAFAYLAECSFPLVVKASGLAAGKGVIICQDHAEARQAVIAMLDNEAFGKAGAEIVVEEFLEGEEASIMVMVSGDEYICLPVSQDHKRVGEGDTGPNTGGMGAYAPASVVDDAMLATIKETIIEPTLAGFRADGIDYRGTLYIGVMLTRNGPQVLEFNVRFGDPECQILLPLCETDPVQLMHACATRTLKAAEVRLKDAHAMIVVLAAKGYPGAYEKGSPIGLPTDLPEGVQIIHAGTKRRADGQFVSAGGRVLGVVAMGETLAKAKHKAYEVCDAIEWEDGFFRRDIAWREFARRGK
jgi:phosphoribosylamine--glycine ligase